MKVGVGKYCNQAVGKLLQSGRKLYELYGILKKERMSYYREQKDNIWNLIK